MLLLPGAPEENDEGHMPPSSQLPLKRQRLYSLPELHIRELLCPQAAPLAQGREELEDQAGRGGKTKLSAFPRVALALKRL